MENSYRKIIKTEYAKKADCFDLTLGSKCVLIEIGEDIYLVGKDEFMEIIEGEENENKRMAKETN